MIYVDEKYENYNRLVEVGNGYVILTNRANVNASWQQPVDIKVVYQDLNRSNNVFDYTKTYTSNINFQKIDTTSENASRPDYCLITLTSLVLITFIIVFIINPLTKLAKKGGVFFG